MLTRMLAAFGKRFSPAETAGERQSPSAQAVSQARRGFFAKAAVGAVSLSGTAGLAKVVVESVPERDLSDRYRKDHVAGEQELAEREYVLMSTSEKEDMLQQLVENYYEKG